MNCTAIRHNSLAFYKAEMNINNCTSRCNFLIHYFKNMTFLFFILEIMKFSKMIQRVKHLSTLNMLF